jgi:hypothetical protein
LAFGEGRSWKSVFPDQDKMYLLFVKTVYKSQSEKTCHLEEAYLDENWHMPISLKLSYVVLHVFLAFLMF